MGYAVNNPAGFLISGTTASGAGAGMDTRNSMNYGFLELVSHSPSAILGFDFSKDGTGWIRLATYTATPTTATAQVSAFLPYVRGVFVTGWGTTGSAYMYYAPGLT